MNRNNETFSQAPTIRMERSKIPMHQNHKTTFNASYIVPFFVNSDILPGDTISLSYSAVIRQTTAQTPTMDNAYADFYFFSVPWRIVWENTKEFFGENTQGQWTQTTEFLIPELYTGTDAAKQVQKGSLADHFGIPIKTANIHFNKLPFRAYTAIYNEYFRDQNLIAPIGNGITTADNIYDESQYPYLVLRKAAKFHDYFTSCLPSPQKASGPVNIPIGTSAPVLSNNQAVTIKNPVDGNSIKLKTDRDSQDAQYIHVLTQAPVGNKGYDLYWGNQTGMYADLSQAVAATVEAMRYSFATQRIYERDARGGTRYREYLKAAFGVNNGDARMQIPEYLGGERVPLQLLQVAQTSATSGNKALGDLAAYGHTATGKHAFTKSFTEHSILIGLVVVRTDQSYDRGLNRMWSRRRRFDVYDPALAFLGEQAVYNKEIFCTGNQTTDNQVFGYQERWAEYRYLPNMITGAFRTNYDRTLDFWHYGNAFESLPVLSKNFIEETTNNLDRTLTVTSSVEDQFLADFQINMDCVRVMPVHSIPGLIDHF